LWLTKNRQDNQYGFYHYETNQIKSIYHGDHELYISIYDLQDQTLVKTQKQKLHGIWKKRREGCFLIESWIIIFTTNFFMDFYST
jgi:hypothetical protein